MQIISFIEDQDVIKTILKHLSFWIIRSSPLAKAHAPLPAEYNRGNSSPLPMNAELRARMGREAKRVFKEKLSMAKYDKDMERLY